MAYTIQMNEPQRAALLKLMQDADAGGSKDDNDPLQYWQLMLATLPSDEADNPGTLHGFCL